MSNLKQNHRENPKLTGYGTERRAVMTNEVEDIIQEDINNISKVSGGAIQLLGKKIGFDMNSVADQLITLAGGTNFIITDIVVTNASVNLNTAADLEVWDAVNRTGNIIANSNFFRGVDQTLPLLTSSNKYVNALSNVGGTALVLGAYNLVITQNNLYISLGVAQGVPATADVYVYGYILK